VKLLKLVALSDCRVEEGMVLQDGGLKAKKDFIEDEEMLVPMSFKVPKHMVKVGVVDIAPSTGKAPKGSARKLIMAELKEMGVKFDPKASARALQDLLAKARDEQVAIAATPPAEAKGKK